jgi:signal transduction histidine kinase
MSDGVVPLRVIRAHGGEIAVQSSEGTGTVFTVTVPRRPG